MKKFAEWILNKSGWKLFNNADDLKKCVICVAPHTSNWDFVIGKLYYMAQGKNASFLMKKEWFFFPLGILFKKMGGVPVDRSKKTSITDQLAEKFHNNDNFKVAITPEGTRKRNPNWKMGFYYIALKANVPIQLAYIDYQKKEVGIQENFYPTGNEEQDLAYIKNFYRDIKGKKPENFAI